uniref:Porin domain-containing protein n=1 Tax=Curvibacter symbiont subsp. Hydra magnipapillata TaxID=667019 RepID=C9YBT2_CURXX|nr:hypothetical protein Csp_A00280 [Curvibacter putative symbiont of Hydra magnipapillata]
MPLKISGRLDVGLKSAIPSDLSKETTASEAVDEGSNARLNFSGSSDIDADLSSYFMIEMRFNADNGAQNDSAALFKDKAWVGLTSKKYGDLKLGRLHSPQYGVSTAGRYEAFSGDSYASMGTRGALAANQWNNAVYYTTPTTSGFNAGLTFSKGEKAAANGIGAHVAYNEAQHQLPLASNKSKTSGTPPPRDHGHVLHGRLLRFWRCACEQHLRPFQQSQHHQQWLARCLHCGCSDSLWPG